MKRRSTLKKLMAGAFAPMVMFKEASGESRIGETSKKGSNAKPVFNQDFESRWDLLNDMTWLGEEYWTQRLQDWGIENGELKCLCRGPNRTVHLLTHQIFDNKESFHVAVKLRFVGDQSKQRKGDFAGFKIGAKGKFDDYRSAIFTGQGLNIGVNTDGSMFIGQQVAEDNIPEEALTRGIQLDLQADPEGENYKITLIASDPSNSRQLSVLKVNQISGTHVAGNIALVSHFNEKKAIIKPAVAFSDWHLTGKKIAFYPEQVYGPIYFAQYSLNNNILKLSAQLAPVDLPGQKAATLEIRKNAGWEKVADAIIHAQARVAIFRVENWDNAQTVPYRVIYEMPMKSGTNRIYSYEGSIAAEPIAREKIKSLVLSCNWDQGFPDNEVIENASKHQADMIFFVGDQFYESNGGFGVERGPLDRSILDYLRKWYQFGWSYRNLFRHIPSACLPDDHDMYHGNIWGCRGKAASDFGNQTEQQDTGGYTMPADWVNMAQLTQTSHMPDPYDATPVLQGITVYYTHWQYGGISFGIVEDRKFKSAPKEVLPAEAKVWNGYAENQEFDVRKFQEPETVRLLGDRQIEFLKAWGADWSKGAQFKVLISATPFNCLQTLPNGTLNDQNTPKLEVPEPGVYVTGDAPTRDMDSDGWPQNRRDEVLKVLRKSFAIHLAGDQHLPSVVQYGVDEHRDAGYVFAVPATCNLWPRRWWPSVDKDHKNIPGQPAYTGNFQDGFGNLMTVHAVANPQKTGKEPALLYDRVTGYGVVTFDKASRVSTLECWPRYVDPIKNSSQQYLGWPIQIKQLENFDKSPFGYLAELVVEGITDPVIQVVNQNNNDVLYTLRIKGQQFKPKVFEAGNYTVHISDPDADLHHTIRDLEIDKKNKQIKVRI